jgi:hypothetical protein
MRTHPLHNLGHILHHVYPYTPSGDPAYIWQGDGTGYWPLYSSQTHPGWSGGSFGDQGTELLHTTIAQLMAKVKGLATHVTSLSKRETEHGKGTDQILTHVEGLETHIKELKGTGKGVGMHVRKLGGASRSVIGDYPLLKVCHSIISPVTFVLKTLACGACDFFSDVWGGGVWE